MWTVHLMDKMRAILKEELHWRKWDKSDIDISIQKFNEFISKLEKDIAKEWEGIARIGETVILLFECESINATLQEQAELERERVIRERF